MDAEVEGRWHCSVVMNFGLPKGVVVVWRVCGNLIVYLVKGFVKSRVFFDRDPEVCDDGTDSTGDWDFASGLMVHVLEFKIPQQSVLRR